MADMGAVSSVGSSGGGGNSSSGASSGAPSTPSTFGGSTGRSGGPQAAPSSTPNGKVTGAPSGPVAGGVSQVEKPSGAPATSEEFKWKEKYKINGREEEREFSRDELKRYSQIGLAADEIFTKTKAERQAIAAEKAKFESIAKGIKEDPAAALRAFGLDPVEFARSQLTQAIQDEQLSPEARELRELKQQMTVREREELRRSEEAKQKAEVEQQDRMWKEYEPQAREAVKALDLPDEPWVFEMMAGVGDECCEIGRTDAADHAWETNRRLGMLAERHIGKMPLPKLKTLLGPQRLKELIADNVAQAKAQGFEQMRSSEPPPVLDENDEDTGMSEEETRVFLHTGRRPNRKKA